LLSPHRNCPSSALPLKVGPAKPSAMLAAIAFDFEISINQVIVPLA